MISFRFGPNWGGAVLGAMEAETVNAPDWVMFHCVLIYRCFAFLLVRIFSMHRGGRNSPFSRRKAFRFF